MMRFRGIFFDNDNVVVEVKIFKSNYQYRAYADARDYCKEKEYARFELWDPEF